MTKTMNLSKETSILKQITYTRKFTRPCVSFNTDDDETSFDHIQSTFLRHSFFFLLFEDSKRNEAKNETYQTHLTILNKRKKKMICKRKEEESYAYVLCKYTGVKRKKVRECKTRRGREREKIRRETRQDEMKGKAKDEESERVK